MNRAWLVGGRKMARWTWVAAMAGAGLLGTACSLRTQGPIKEVAYDFSDRDFYDRAYAPSPRYLETEEGYAVLPLRPTSARDSFEGEPSQIGTAGPSLPPEAASLPAVVLAHGAVAGRAAAVPGPQAARPVMRPSAARLPRGAVVAKRSTR